MGVQERHRIRVRYDGFPDWLIGSRRGAERRDVMIVPAASMQVTTADPVAAVQRSAAEPTAERQQIAAGFAHDFNNLLTIIGGSLEAFVLRHPCDDSGRRLLHAAQVGVERGVRLNAQMLALASERASASKTVHASIVVNDLLPDLIILLDRVLRDQIELRIDQGPDIWPCIADPVQLESAILNLALNARDAMEGAGRLELSTRNVTTSPPSEQGAQSISGDYVAITVRDDGVGIAPGALAHVLEPFFTTKGPGRGTGLGLSQVADFARLCGGFVRIDSVVGKGTEVSIHIPRLPRADAD